MEQKIARTTLYHASSPDRRESILQNGLQYEDVIRNFEGVYEDDFEDENEYGVAYLQPRGIYLWNSYQDAATKWSMGSMDIWAVDSTGLQLSKDFAFARGTAWITRDPIPPDRLELIKTNLDPQFIYDPLPSVQEEVARKWRESNIFDPVEKLLDQRVFQDETPKQSIQSFIKRLYYRQFSKVFGVPLSKVPEYVNLALTGSLTTYQYSDSSDCDVSVFLDWDKVYQNLDLIPQDARTKLIAMHIDHLDGTFLPGGSHPLQFFAVKQGIGPEDKFKPGLRSGYDLDSQTWIVKPEKERSHNIESDFPDVYQRASDIADKMEAMLNEGDEDTAKKLWLQVHKKRQLDQQSGLGDFSEGNITYKWLVHQGLVDRLRHELGLQISTSVKESVDWSGELDPRQLDAERELGGMAVWEKLEKQVVELADHLDSTIHWIDRNMIGRPHPMGGPGSGGAYQILDENKNWNDPSNVDFKPILWIPHITGEASYLIALHELGHAVFSTTYGAFHSNSFEEESWCWHFAIENAQISISDETLEYAQKSVKTYDSIFNQVNSDGYPGWFKEYDHKQINREREEGKLPPLGNPLGGFEMPIEILDRWIKAMQCPYCQSNLFKENNEIWCPKCGFETKTSQWKVSATTMYHVAPTADRVSIQTHGLDRDKGSSYVTPNSEWHGNYFWDTFVNAEKYAQLLISWDEEELSLQEHMDHEEYERYLQNLRRIVPQEWARLTNDSWGSYDIWQVNLPTDIPLKADPYFIHREFEKQEWKGPHGIPGAFMIQAPITPENLRLVKVRRIGEGYESYEPFGDSQSIFGKVAAEKMRVLYDFEKDRIILGSWESAAGVQVIGEYDGDGSVTLYEAEKNWVNPTYFRRLWNYSYPHRPLKEVHYQKGEAKKKLLTKDHPHHERHVSMAERTGDPVIDKLIDDYFTVLRSQQKKHILRDPQWAAGACEYESEAFETWIAPQLPEGWQVYQDIGRQTPESWGYEDRSTPGKFQRHTATIIEKPDGTRFMVDFTAAQYGYSEFPMVQRLNDGGWQREWESHVV